MHNSLGIHFTKADTKTLETKLFYQREKTEAEREKPSKIVLKDAKKFKSRGRQILLYKAECWKRNFFSESQKNVSEARITAKNC